MLTCIEIDLIDVTAIESNAFINYNFFHVETLILKNLQVGVLTNGSFNGLISLRSLKLYSLVTYDFKPGFLTGISSTLGYFTFNQMFDSDSAMNIDGLTGGIILQAVKLVKIRTNLNGTLTSESFSALVSVEILLLSDCEIEVLAPDTFIHIKTTLKKLNLERNRLKTIYADFLTIFDDNLPYISLNGNPWHCDCLLIIFQAYISNYSNIVDGDKATCNTPVNLNNQLVKEVYLCSDPISVSTTESAVTLTTLGLNPNSGVIHKQCPTSSQVISNDTISITIRRPSLNLNITQNNRGELIVTEKHVDPSIFLIWFPTNSKKLFIENTRDVSFNCMSSVTPLTVIRDLATDTSYTFCLMNRSSSQLSPLNCGSYYNRSPGYQVGWISSNKIWVIGGSVIVLLMSIIFGFFLGFLILRQNPNWMKSTVENYNAEATLKSTGNNYVSDHPDNRLSDTM